MHRATALLSVAAVLAAATVVGLVAFPAENTPDATLSTVTTAPAPQDELHRRAQSVLNAGAAGFLARVDDGEHVATVAVGQADRIAGRTLTATDRFAAGSQTKTFLAVLVLQLRDQDKVRLDAPIETYLPGVVPNGSNITVRMLLQHTSGLYDWGFDASLDAELKAAPTRVFTTEHLLRLSFSHKPEFRPGAQFSYSSTGYTLIGLMLEEITGKPVKDLIRQRITEPLTLPDTYLAENVPDSDDLAHGYLIDPVHKPYRYTDTSGWTLSWAGAAGALISTTKDLSTFYQVLMSGTLLPKTQLAQMMRTVPVPSDQGGGAYGLGLEHFSTPCGPVWGHSGNVPGHLSLTVVTADGDRVASSDITSRIDQEGTTTPAQVKFDGAAYGAQGTTVCQMLGEELPLIYRK